jgi:phytoene/squalene synthetase
MTTPAPDFRSLCAELLADLEVEAYAHWVIDPEDHPLCKRARAALATPPPEPPTDEEIATAFQKGADQEFYATVEALTKYCDAGVELTDSDAREVLYELRRPHIVLDHWGNEKQ